MCGCVIVMSLWGRQRVDSPCPHTLSTHTLSPHSLFSLHTAVCVEREREAERETETGIVGRQTRGSIAPCNALRHTATPCSALQRPATPCSALQCPATPCNTTICCDRVLRLQCVAVCCSALALQCVAVCCFGYRTTREASIAFMSMQRTVTRCTTLQHTATSCSALQQYNQHNLQ